MGVRVPKSGAPFLVVYGRASGCARIMGEVFRIARKIGSAHVQHTWALTGTCVLEIDVYLCNGLCSEQASVWFLKISYSAVVAVDVLSEALAKEVVGCQFQGLV